MLANPHQVQECWFLAGFCWFLAFSRAREERSARVGQKFKKTAAGCGFPAFFLPKNLMTRCTCPERTPSATSGTGSRNMSAPIKPLRRPISVMSRLVSYGKLANRFIRHTLSSAIFPASLACSSSDPKPMHTRFGEDGGGIF
jgi:hypothetical protein